MAKTKATKETKDLIPAGAENLPVTAEDDDGLGDFESSDLSIPWIKIVQPTSDAGTPGRFLQTLTEEESETVDAIFLKVQRGRVKWKKGDRSAPECKSIDYYNPSPEIEEPLSDQCAAVEMRAGKRVVIEVCPYGQWQGAGKKQTAPECATTYTFLGLAADMDTGGYIPFLMSVHGKSLQPAKKFISAVKLKRRKLSEFSVTLSLKLETNDKGKFYVAKFGDIVLLDPDTREEIAPYIEAFKAIELRPAEIAPDEDMGGL